LTALKHTFSLFFISLAYFSYGQLGHYLVSPHAGQSSTPIDSIGNISWSIGEPIVFNTDLAATKAASPSFGIAQSMQSYPTSPVVIKCPSVIISSVKTILCGNFHSLQLNYKISDTTLLPDAIQWYFAETSTSDTSQLTKVAGAQSPVFKPYFPGYYAVKLRFNALNCTQVFSPAFHVSNAANTVSAPSISKSGDVLTAVPDGQLGTPTLQWYAYLNSLGRYLLVAGGTSANLTVRYNADYMVVATYPDSCRLSSVFTVGDYPIALFRAMDTHIDGNTIYIPNTPGSAQYGLQVFPNPATGSFNVTYSSSSEINSKLQVYSDAGIFLRELDFTEGSPWDRSVKISTEDMSAGLYLIKVSDGAKSLTQKVMIYK
jgi:hypothetical protein